METLDLLDLNAEELDTFFALLDQDETDYTTLGDAEVELAAQALLQQAKQR